MFRKRRRYIHLFERSLKAQQAATQAAALAKQAKAGKSPTAGAEAAALVAASPALTPEEQAEVDTLEETMPLDSLVVWRTIAHAAMRRQAKLVKVRRRRRRRRRCGGEGKRCRCKMVMVSWSQSKSKPPSP
jgi:hypothetical protein